MNAELALQQFGTNFRYCRYSEIYSNHPVPLNQIPRVGSVANLGFAYLILALLLGNCLCQYIVYFRL